MRNTVKIPELITVHAGPPDAPAKNYTIPYTDYIKNVVSRAVSPLWPEEAIRAVIIAAQTYALGRLAEGYYRGKGYGFDITGDDGHDQRFEPDGWVFANVSRLVDELADFYASRAKSQSPIRLTYHDEGERSWSYAPNDAEGDGLTPKLACRRALKGRTAEEILRKAFGDIQILRGNERGAMPARCPLSAGDRGMDVAELQRRLNLISTSFAGIPKVNPAESYYGRSTENAVRAFQRIFELPDTGRADRATLRRIKTVYDLVRRLLKCREAWRLPYPLPTPRTVPQKEGQEGETPFRTLTEGDSGEDVRFAQNLLNIAALYTRTVKQVPPTGVYDRATTESVVDFQLTYGLPPTGDIDLETYEALLSLYNVAYARLNASAFIPQAVPFGGRELRLGSRGDDVYWLQTYLNCAADLYGDVVGRVRVTGTYDAETREAVRAVQQIHGLEPTGIVKEGDWAIIAALYNDCAAARFLEPGILPPSLPRGQRRIDGEGIY